MSAKAKTREGDDEDTLQRILDFLVSISESLHAERHIMLTPPEAARQLRVSPERVIVWIRAGKLRASNIGEGPKRPRYRIHPDAITDFLAAREVRPRVRAPRRRKDPEVIEFFK